MPNAKPMPELPFVAISMNVFQIQNARLVPMARLASTA
jgi:hypothetical protein